MHRRMSNSNYTNHVYHLVWQICTPLVVKKECFNKNKKIPVKPLVIEVNRYKDTFRLYYIFTNSKGV